MTKFDDALREPVAAATHRVNRCLPAAEAGRSPRSRIERSRLAKAGRRLEVAGGVGLMLIIMLGSQLPVDAQTRDPRPPHAKPELTVLGPMDNPLVVDVQFSEGTNFRDLDRDLLVGVDRLRAIQRGLRAIVGGLEVTQTDVQGLQRIAMMADVRYPLPDAGVEPMVQAYRGALVALTNVLSFLDVLESHGLEPAAVRRAFSRSKADLDDERNRAQDRGGRTHADLNFFYRVALTGDHDAAEFCNDLNRLPFVELASPAPQAIPPPASVLLGTPDYPPPTPDYTVQQGHLASPPGGIGATEVLSHGADGTGVTVVDIEYGWVLDHEDLELTPNAQVSGYQPVGRDADHGTAVLGVVGGKNNAYGVTGIAPGASIRVEPAETIERGPDVADAISRATAVLDVGDVILIQQQLPVCGMGFGPVEWDGRAYRAITRAVDLGITVVEAAGNGALDLDHPQCSDLFDRRYDSGAIVVGAGTGPDRGWYSLSSYGNRVDLQGWGRSVVTTGYGDLFGPPDSRQRYTLQFSGTSSASAIVAGAVLSIQGALAQRNRPLLEPRDMRDLLVTTGTPQSAPTSATHHVGPLPDLPAALAELGIR